VAVLSHCPLILASGSAIRQQMLKSVGLTFSVEPSGVDEEDLAARAAHLPVAQRTVMLARAKALTVSALHPDACVIGADQMCVLDDTVLNKPGSFDCAEAQLAQLSGKTHLQHCGTVIVRGSEVLWEHEASAQLTMRPLTPEEIHAYIGADAPLSSCGSYKFESLGRHLFSDVTGDHDVIKGLPLVPLLHKLHALQAISLIS
jgi:septum formation protein